MRAWVERLRDAFPPLNLKLVDGGELALPNDNWTLLLIYRGYW